MKGIRRLGAFVICIVCLFIVNTNVRRTYNVFLFYKPFEILQKVTCFTMSRVSNKRISSMNSFYEYVKYGSNTWFIFTNIHKISAKIPSTARKNLLWQRNMLWVLTMINFKVSNQTPIKNKLSVQFLKS